MEFGVKTRPDEFTENLGWLYTVLMDSAFPFRYVKSGLIGIEETFLSYKPYL
ncbi:MAG: hypothetical protein ACK4SN_00295 [Bellilinea sp.]